MTNQGTIDALQGRDVAEVAKMVEAANVLAELVKRQVDMTGGDPPWEPPAAHELEEAVREWERALYPNQDGFSPPLTAIEEEIDRAAWVLRRLVGRLGFQAHLRVYNGDYGERGTTIQRGVRINVLRDSFDGQCLQDLAAFAQDHNCELEISQKHGATLRLRARLGTEQPTSEGSGEPLGRVHVTGVTATASTSSSDVEDSSGASA